MLSLIRHFIHDTECTRWSKEYIDVLIEEARLFLSIKAKSIINDRNIKRLQASLNSNEIITRTITVPLIDGKSLYNLPTDILQIISVRYNGKYIPHKHISDSVSTDDENFIFSYNVESEANDTIRINPIPKTQITLKNKELNLKLSSPIEGYPFNFNCVNTNANANANTNFGKLKNCNIDTSISHILSNVTDADAYNYFGWGSINGNTVSPLTLPITENIDNIQVDKTELTVTYIDDVINLDLKNLDIVYSTKLTKDFISYSEDEIKQSIVTNKTLIKLYVTSILLRSDSDSNSIQLGNQELSLLSDYLNLYTSLYTENYIIDDKLKVAYQSLPKFKDSSALLQESLQNSKIAEAIATKDKAIFEIELAKYNISKLDLRKEYLTEDKHKLVTKKCTVNKYSTT